MFIPFTESFAAGPDSALVTLNLENAPLKKAFDAIQAQTDYQVMYDDNLLAKAALVTVHVKNRPLTDVLALLFVSQPFTYSVVGQSVIVMPRPPEKGGVGLPSQGSIGGDITVTGVVLTDLGSKPLAGASVIAGSGGSHAVTDNNGRFILSLPRLGDSILVSYIGYSAKALWADGHIRQPVTIYLAVAQNEIQDVSIVSTGYQNLPKERSTGSFAQVGHKRFNEVVGINVTDRLQYMTNGLTAFPQRIASGNNGIIIRGLSSLSVKEPLIVLDNFPYNGDIANINPNDVENVTILKDAAAASIWGAKAANGVIVITTRKGRFNQPVRLGLNTNVTLTGKPDIFSLKKISTSDFIDVEQFLFANGHRFSDTLQNYLPFSPVYELLFSGLNGRLTSGELRQRIDALRGLDVRGEYDRYFYRKGVSQQYNLQARGGSDNLAWILSAGFDRSDGSLAERYDRYTLRFDNTYKVAKGFEVNTNIYFTQSSLSSGRPSYGSISTSKGTVPPYCIFR